MDLKNTSQSENGQSLLKNLSGKIVKKTPDVIYGLYDNSKQPLWVRVNDFFIDHSRVPLQEKAYFFHLLAVMLDAGISLVDALKILAARTKNEHFRRILTTVAYNVIQGKKFSDAIARFPEVFGDMEVGIVRSGEAAGNMDKMLFRLSEQLDKNHELQIKLVTASVYPLAVLSILLLVAGGMLIWVIPSLVNLLKEGGLQEKDFPVATRILLDLSSFLASYWWACIFFLVILYLFLKVMISSENGRFRFDFLKLKLPIIGTLLRRVLVLRFISMLGILIEAGLPVVQSLTIIASSLSNQLYRLKVWEVIAKVQQGEKISTSLSDTPFLFPETVTQMLAVGEQSASIGMIAQKVGAHYDREIDNSLKRLTSLFEPIMIVFVGFTVALLALAILTPIFRLSQLV